MLIFRYRVFILMSVVSLLMVLVGCSTGSDPQTNDQRLQTMFPLEELKEVHVQLYREGTSKAQPELMAMYVEEPDLSRIVNWIHQGVKSDFEGNLESLSLFQFNYGTKEKVTGTKYIMYAATTEAEFYIKPFHKTPEFDFDTYRQEDGEQLVSLLGKTDWYKVEEAK
ncbi:hypothetical protein [Brevibacillus migulae]|uniref:hypothetical protein n=1 Tax=Brevibacillus migulae TaxID=1644114 RepID=UPI00106E3469|nr:hypothetical protein [Brevibacillus migulae]